MIDPHSVASVVCQALDPRTRMVLYKMLNRGVFKELNGCISTGKEVNDIFMFFLDALLFGG